ncbi:MAG: hypothetical protein KJP17_06590 [Gammaproteobacteria bacterium]|nr:hypothetical protein [Gammaproteobacteria bacterium]
MKNSIFRSVLAAVLTICGLTLGVWGTAVAGSDKLSSDTRKELAQARQATARYHDIANAIADGYGDAAFILPGVGCHLINFGLVLDFEIDVTKPELLIYSGNCDGAGNDKPVLRAVEYVTPCAAAGCPDTPVPDGFSGDKDVWEPFVNDNDQVYLWTLHAWVWRNNPDGIFVKINPRISD